MPTSRQDEILNNKSIPAKHEKKSEASLHQPSLYICKATMEHFQPTWSPTKICQRRPIGKLGISSLSGDEEAYTASMETTPGARPPIPSQQ